MTGIYKNPKALSLYSDLFEVLELDMFLAQDFEEYKNPIVILLDEISDPHNLGAIARSAECAGAIGLIMTERNSAPLSPAAIKASAGALKHIPVVKVGNLVSAIEKLKEVGFWIVGKPSFSSFSQLN